MYGAGAKRPPRSIGRGPRAKAFEDLERFDPPGLTLDAAMLLCDAALKNAGSSQACARAEVEQAFAYLSSPNVGLAVRDGDALVILDALRPLGHFCESCFNCAAQR
jgi:hypothetical protein